MHLLKLHIWRIFMKDENGRQRGKISVIIPNYNDADTLPLCLEAVLNSDYPDFEVIVVDDNSTDNSREMIEKYDVKLLLHEDNRGQGAGRNTGAEQASGEILLFIDGDVCIKKDTLRKIADIFSQRSDIAAVVGMLDNTYVYKNICSIHFNRRLRYNYSMLPDYMETLYCTVSAVRKNAFRKIGGFTEGMTAMEDSEIGFRLVAEGYKILHSKHITVTHHKNIGFFGLLRNDFNRTVDRMKLLLGRRMVSKMVSEKKFGTNPLYQLLSPVVAFWAFWFLVGTAFYEPLIIPLFVMLLFFLFLNWGYLCFSYRDDGFLFCMRLFCLLLIDMLVVSFAIFWGGVLFLKGEKY